MKQISKIIAFVVGFASFQQANAQTQLINSGTQISIKSSTYIQGTTLLNEANGLLKNDGLLHLKGDMIQDQANYIGDGLVAFDGVDDQYMEGDITVATLKINNNKALHLDADEVTISNNLDLSNNSSVFLGETNLMLVPNATISAYNPNHYIHTNGSGALSQEILSEEMLVFPVGNQSYSPAKVQNNGATERIDLLVENNDEVQQVNSLWHLASENGNFSNLDVELNWELTASHLDFDANNCAVAQLKEGEWLASDHGAATTDGNIQGRKFKGIAELGTFTVTSPITTVVTTASFSAKVHLFPNPSVDILNVEIEGLEGEEDLILSIFSEDGKIVHQQANVLFSEDVIQIPEVINLTPGIYSLRIEKQDKSFITKQFIKSN
jgi:hypothetical protein